jgi:predicted AAA+ superfamily ATPase
VVYRPKQGELTLQIRNFNVIFTWMINRTLEPKLLEALTDSPAVALLGPRQVGKTTLALESAKKRAGAHIYLDLESEPDLQKLASPTLFLQNHLDKLVIIDEVHRYPGLFPQLRGLIDQARRQPHASGLYLLLGSASLDLLKQTGESLAGRVRYLELSPFLPSEINSSQQSELWLRGGFPESFLASSYRKSFQWRRDFIRSYMERDVNQFAPRLAVHNLRTLWSMLAHQNGGLLNLASLSRSLGVDQRTVGNYVQLLEDFLLVRRLPAWHRHSTKRLVRAPKVYIRDTGVLHALLGLETQEQLLGHPILGASWEGFVLESIANTLGERAQPYFYRAASGAETDLLLEWDSGERWVLEIKHSLSPKVSRGFHSACNDLKPSQRFVVTPGHESWPLDANTQVISLNQALNKINERVHRGA